jgi:hypothetical protein
MRQIQIKRLKPAEEVVEVYKSTIGVADRLNALLCISGSVSLSIIRTQYCIHHTSRHSTRGPLYSTQAKYDVKLEHFMSMWLIT